MIPTDPGRFRFSFTKIIPLTASMSVMVHMFCLDVLLEPCRFGMHVLSN